MIEKTGASPAPITDRGKTDGGVGTGGGAGMYRAALEMQEMRMRCVWKNGDTDCLYTMMHAYRISD